MKEVKYKSHESLPMIDITKQKFLQDFMNITNFYKFISIVGINVLSTINTPTLNIQILGVH